MKQNLKLILRWLRWGLAVVGLSWVLTSFILVLLNQYFIMREPDTAVLIAEIGIAGFSLALQFIPLKD